MLRRIFDVKYKIIRPKSKIRDSGRLITSHSKNVRQKPNPEGPTRGEGPLIPSRRTKIRDGERYIWRILALRKREDAFWYGLKRPAGEGAGRNLSWVAPAGGKGEVQPNWVRKEHVKKKKKSRKGAA